MNLAGLHERLDEVAGGDGGVERVDEPAGEVHPVQCDPGVVGGDAVQRQREARAQRHEPAATVAEQIARAGVGEHGSHVVQVGLGGLIAGQRGRVGPTAPVVQVHGES